jgi:hypothetical protein
MMLEAARTAITDLYSSSQSLVDLIDAQPTNTARQAS